MESRNSNFLATVPSNNYIDPYIATHALFIHLLILSPSSLVFFSQLLQVYFASPATIFSTLRISLPI